MLEASVYSMCVFFICLFLVGKSWWWDHTQISLCHFVCSHKLYSYIVIWCTAVQCKQHVEECFVLMYSIPHGLVVKVNEHSRSIRKKNSPCWIATFFLQSTKSCILQNIICQKTSCRQKEYLTTEAFLSLQVLIKGSLLT